MSLWLLIERYKATNRFVVEAATAAEALDARSPERNYISGETEREPAEIHELVVVERD